MKNKSMWKKPTSLLMAGILASSTFALPVAAETQTEPLSSFVEQFENAEGDAKPWIRWWFSPGAMTEEETRRQVRSVKEDGFGGLEMVALSTDAVFGDDVWNETMRWILEEAQECDLKLAYTIGVSWPVKTPEISDADDIRAQQGVFAKTDEFVAEDGNMNYTKSQVPFPDEQFDPSRPYELVAVTAAKVGEDGVYEADSAVDITECVKNLTTNDGFSDVSNASVEWEAPESGKWTVFYLYRQSLESGDTPVVDHFSAASTDAVLGYWENDVLGDDYLRGLYEANGGEIFCDSLELGSRDKSKAALWTADLIEEFKNRRGYDITPYLPAIFIENIYHNYPRAGAHETTGMSEDWASDYDFGEEGYRVRDDFLQTLTELFRENHVKKIADWAHTHNMSLRYQVYGSVMDVTQSGLDVDVHETETLSSSDILDFYRTQTGTVHMTGSGVYSTETAAVAGLGWTLSWTGSEQEDGEWDAENYYRTDGDNWIHGRNYKGFAGGAEDAGILYHMNRQMAVGVNRIVMHGFSYDGSGMGTMFSNPWGDVSPLWENVNDMTDYLSRSQLVLRQGQADIDLAVYHLRYYEWCCTDKTPTEEWNMSAAEKAGYSYDYLSPALLDLDNAVVSNVNGIPVLAENGPSYKALILDQRVKISPDETKEGPEISKIQNDMPVETAEKILDYAKSGLPVVIVGEVPYRVNTFAGSSENMNNEDAKLADLMNELIQLDNVKIVESEDDIPDALDQLNVEPDAKKDVSTPVLTYHRAADDADYYYLYNSDLNNEISNAISLKGTGTPYLLDSWSGEISAIGQYEEEDGRIVLDVDLEPNENMFVAIAKDGWKEDAPDGSEKTRSFENVPDAFELKNWSMTMEDWQPSENGNLREFNKVESGPYELEELVPWNEIEGLATAGGVGTYTTTFELEEGWENSVGAIIDFGYVSDTMQVTVNGNEVKGINQLSKRVDIGKYLVAGTNEIKVEVASSLANSKGQERNEKLGMAGPVMVYPYRQVSLED